MANYYGTSRTSYTKVEDPEKFKKWVQTIPEVDIIERDGGDAGTLYGLIFNNESGTIPDQIVNEETEQFEDIDIYAEIQDHLAPGWSITFKEVGAEKHRYLVGFVAVVTKDEIFSTSLEHWADKKVKELITLKSAILSQELKFEAA